MNFFYVIIHGCMATLLISAQGPSPDINHSGLTSTNSSRHILETLLSAKNVTFLKSKDILEGKKEIPNMRKLQMAVTEENRVFAVDFTDTNDMEYADSLKQMILSKLAIHFSCDLLIVTRYKNGIMFTPVDDIKDPDVAPLLSTAQLRKIMMRSTDPLSSRTKGSESSSKGGDQPVPNISFYLNIQYNIPYSKCVFDRSPNHFLHGKKVFCEHPHISLIFQVNLQRSLKFGISGGATPDAKIVRISADADTGGAGIHLNDELVYHRYVAPWVVIDGFIWDWSSSAIASDYTVDVKASNEKASVLKTVPENNINPKTEFKEISGFTVGISGDVEGSKEGAKVKLGASATFTQQRWITIETHDYKMERLTSGPQNMKFKMVRETYPKASSLLYKYTDPVWMKYFPADLKRVQPMGYASYVPKLDVVYAASKDETGTTEFSVDASVGIMPLYHGAYQHYYVIGAHLSYHGHDREGTPVSCNKRFTVDWENPVFTGGRPVNLQSKAFPDKCIEIDNNGHISLAKGDIFSEKQSFIFDEFGRYKSTKNLKMCLDASNLNMLQPCSTSLTQRWEWEKGSDHLTNVYIKGKLGYDKSTSKFGIFRQDSDTVITDIVTAYTQLFSSKST